MRHFPDLHMPSDATEEIFLKTGHIKKGGAVKEEGADYKNDPWQIPRGPQGEWKALSLLSKLASESARTISRGPKALLGSIGLQRRLPKHHLSYTSASCQIW